MYITNVSDYENMTDDYNDTLSLNNNYNINGNIIDIILPTLLSTKQYGLTFLCLMSLMIYT